MFLCTSRQGGVFLCTSRQGGVFLCTIVLADREECFCEECSCALADREECSCALADREECSCELADREECSCELADKEKMTIPAIPCCASFVIPMSTFLPSSMATTYLQFQFM